ncbi:MAG: hypothetical protein MJ183_00775 [Treponemataceae bacterium]|nr:hypothetical protein [Treponemataceae bacterium]
MATYRLVYNTLSGNGKGKKIAEELAATLSGDTIEMCSITDISNYSAFAESLKDGESVLLCGGDGTLNRFINDYQTQTGFDPLSKADFVLPFDLYYYAAGSGNDFFHDITEMLKVGQDKPVKINDMIKRLPAVTVKGKTYQFVNGVGYGIDGYCCQVGDELRKIPGKKVDYTGIAIKGLLFHYKRTNAEITVDGKSYSFRKVWLAPTMFGRYYGGGMIPTPEQNRSTSGHVSTMVYYGVGKLKALIVFPSIFKGEHVAHKEMITVFTGSDVSVKFDRPTALQIDGETILDVTEYRVQY